MTEILQGLITFHAIQLKIVSAYIELQCKEKWGTGKDQHTVDQCNKNVLFCYQNTLVVTLDP